MSTLKDDDYNLTLIEFQQKIENLEPHEKESCMFEYCRRLALAAETKLAEKDMKLAEKDMKLAEKDTIIADIVAEKEVLTKRLKISQTLEPLTGAPSTVFKYICKLSLAPETCKTCPEEKIMDAWKNCKNPTVMPDLMADAALSRVKEEDVQLAFSLGLVNILSTLRCNHSITQKTQFNGSMLIPDIVVANQGVTKPCLHDALAVIELKSPSVTLSEAAAQAALYLAEISKYRQTRDLSLSSLVAVGSNYGEICVFGFSKFDPEPELQLYTSAQSECFPKGWKSLKKPTTGFTALCHAIYQMGDSASTKYMKINNDNVPITGTMSEMEGVGIYICTYLGEDIVVKQGYGKRGKGLVEHELEKLEVVSEIEAFSPYLLPWRRDLQIQHGFAMPLATVISDGSSHELVLLENQYRWLLQGLRILHNNHLYHMDIRPGNIVIYDNKARFIDWFTLQRDEIIHAWLRQGHDDPFWPVLRDKFDKKNLFDLWDLISLGYTFLFLAVNEITHRFEMQTDRLGLVRKLSTDNTFVGKVARIIQYLEESNGESDSTLLYDKCLTMLNGF